VVTVNGPPYTLALELVVGSVPSIVYRVLSTPDPAALSAACSETVTGLVPNQFAQLPELHEMEVVGAVTSELIVKDHEKSDARALPFASVTPPEPPDTLAVYVAPGVSGELGVSVAFVVAAS
jgi:hypothetical protein